MLKTSFIERFNGTMRERLAALTRKCRHALIALIRFRNRNVSDRMHLQLLLSASRIERNNAFWMCLYACYGCRIDGSISGICGQCSPIRWLLHLGSNPSGENESRPGVDQAIPKRPRGRPRKHPLPDPTLPKRPRFALVRSLEARSPMNGAVPNDKAMPTKT